MVLSEVGKNIAVDVNKVVKSVKPYAQKAIGAVELATAPAKKSKIRFIQRIPQPQRLISREQAMLSELVGGGQPTFGTGTCLPKVQGILRRGRGLMNSGDMGETGSMFGVRR